jgi:hypothetical protein
MFIDAPLIPRRAPEERNVSGDEVSEIRYVSLLWSEENLLGLRSINIRSLRDDGN